MNAISSSQTLNISITAALMATSSSELGKSESATATTSTAASESANGIIQPHRSRRIDMTEDQTDSESIRTDAMKSVLEIVCNQSANTLEVKFVLDFVKRHAEDASMLLPLLILWDLVTKASYGMPPEEIANRVEEFIEYEWRSCDAFSMSKEPAAPLVVHELLEALQSLPLHQQRDISDFLEKRDDEGAMVASPVFVQMLIREGVHLHTLRDSMLTLSRLYDRSCYGVQHSTTTFDEVWELAQPLFRKRGSSRAPTVLELVPLIQLIRKMPHIMMSNQKHSGHFAKYSDAFIKWLSLNPAIQRYLDPPSVLIQPSNVPALPNIAAIMAALPDRFPVHANVRLPNLAGAAGAGNPISNLFTLPTAQEAQAFSVAARQHYGNGFGGGGPLPAHNIIQFSTAGAGFQFW